MTQSRIQVVQEERAEKARESRLRQAVARHGYHYLTKSRCRTPQALEYGRYMIVDGYNNAIVAGGGGSGFSMDLDQVEAWVKASNEE